MRKRILVLDDNKDTLDFMKEALNYEKFEVKITSNSDDIIEHIQIWRPDLVILDYKKNGLKGDFICRQIKTNPTINTLPVIICSAYLNKKYDNEIFACGCDDFIAKPFGFDELIDKVNNLIAV